MKQDRPTHTYKTQLAHTCAYTNNFRTQAARHNNCKTSTHWLPTILDKVILPKQNRFFKNMYRYITYLFS